MKKERKLKNGKNILQTRLIIKIKNIGFKNMFKRLFLSFILVKFSAYSSQIAGENMQNTLNNLEPSFDKPSVYNAGKDLPTRLAEFDLGSGKILRYYAVWHTNKKDSIVFQTIKEQINNFNPDVVIIEGCPNHYGISPTWMVDLANRRYQDGNAGENLYTVYLANQQGVPFIGGEMKDVTYKYHMLEQGYLLEDAVFFHLVQKIPFWHLERILDHQIQIGAKEEKRIQTLYENFIRSEISTWLEENLDHVTYNHFQAWHQKHYDRPYDIAKDYTSENFHIQVPTFKGEGSKILSKAQAEMIILRDRYLINVIRDQINNPKYHRVLVVLGAFHWEWQKRRLQYLFGEPRLLLEYTQNTQG